MVFDVKHLRPRLVIDVPDGLASRSADASIVEEKGSAAAA
jgi:hypothetical protein